MDNHNAKPITKVVDKKRARRKYMSVKIATHLIEANPGSSLAKAYERTLHCMETLTPNAEGRLVSHYCKNRWCPVCQAIRLAVLVNGYKPQLEQLDDPYFVTLTRPTCSAKELPGQIQRMGKAFRQIKSRKGFRGVKGLRKAECTIRPDGQYHYHFHIIIEGKDNAARLVDAWLKLNPDADIEAQDMRKADDTSVEKLFKYFTKICVTDKSNKHRVMDYKRLDVVFRALSGKRIFQPFGGLKMVSEDIDEEVALEAVRDIAPQTYEWVGIDWYGLEYGDGLTGYKPDDELVRWLDPGNAIYNDS